MNKSPLNNEEKDFVEAFESGELQSVLSANRRRFIEQSAAETSKKDKRINIRISSRDLVAIQRRALREGMPYQTLVSSILHKYISGSLCDVTPNMDGKI